MARPLRIEYPDAYYHVSNSSELGFTLFPGKKYYQAFLDGLGEACARFNVEIHAYCLLKNEYHLLLKTPEGNLSRFMRQVDGLYTQHYQAGKNLLGSIFHSRYKAVLLQANPYLLEVSRYIHALPVRGKKSAVDIPWSSMAAYAIKAKAPEWLERDEVLGMFGKRAGKSARAYAAYLKFVDENLPEEITAFYARKNRLSILGSEQFIKSARSKASPAKPRGLAKGKQARKRPSMKKVVEAVAKYFKVSEKSIYQASRGPSSKNVPRWIAMHLCQELSGVTLQDIAKRFGLKRYGTVSTTVGKLKNEVEIDPKIARAVNTLRKRLKT